MNLDPITRAATIVAILALVGLSACSKKSAPPTVEILLTDLVQTNGRLFKIGDSNYFTGVMIEKFPDGQLKSRSSVSNGVLWGLSEGWHTNGQLQVRETFLDGKSEGLRSKWDFNGVKISEATIVGGKLNGLFRRWHTNGILADEVVMTNDQPNGLARAWYPSGAPKAEIQLANGDILHQKRWDDESRRP
ncbi:MAG: toxin-antitoxin system YwqK family antitoxin [Verrucomicrobiota bacterium]|nr:toxin-antitoxin system YwqK family antitoxin [Verrucomicrobiota bacterium]